MKEIYTEIEINAPAKVVWDILTDFDHYPQWNPFIQEISGDQTVGAQIEVFIKSPNSNGIKFKPKILSYKPEEELRWLGALWIPKLFDGEHSLIIEEIDENKILFIQKEKFTGLLVPLVSSMLNDTESGFKNMNRALKREAEDEGILKR
ncbi:MAG: SRPBCC domain-containing protein [Euryarchaeota archaeon]|nr:SRPBCC domain-containing protein [Euryarchaeota archaeon]MBU4548010.1 SRPBCC domain-containing protein [Euryarchaeota archaeon]